MSDKMRKKPRAMLFVAALAFAGTLPCDAYAANRAPAPYLAFADVFDHDNPAVSEARLRSLALQAHAAGDFAIEAEILTQIARSQGLEGKFAEAHADLDRATAMDTHSPRVAIRIAIERGRLFRLSGSPEKARICFRDGFEKARIAHETYLMLDAVHMIALNEPFASSRFWVSRGLRIAARSADPKSIHWVAVLNNNLGVGYMDRHDYARAAAAFQAAFVAYKAQHADADTLREAQTALTDALQHEQRAKQ
jgi:tetratricopeptide (TPR) repeat protein